jgi:hypothetical protein
MPDHRKPSRLKALVLALPVVVLVSPLAAQTSAPPAATDPVHVADLIDRPILDENKSIMGHVRAIVRNGDGKIQLLLPLGGLFGFGERLVGVPIESVALTGGAQVMVVDMPPDRFQKSATWYGSNSATLAPAETILISRR